MNFLVSTLILIAWALGVYFVWFLFKRMSIPTKIVSTVIITIALVGIFQNMQAYGPRLTVSSTPPEPPRTQEVPVGEEFVKKQDRWTTFDDRIKSNEQRQRSE